MSEPRPVPHPDRRVYIGRVARVRGLRGDLRVVPLTWDHHRFERLDELWCEAPDQSVHHLHIKRLRVESDAVFLRFQETPLRDLAEPLVGGRLFIDIEDRAELPDDMFYHDDAIGCEVVDVERGPLGTVTGVLSPSAHEVLEVTGPSGEILIPVAGGMVVEMDLAGKTIRVDLPEGLIEATAGESDREWKRQQRRERLAEGRTENTSGAEDDPTLGAER
ncbi:16S rRNA processing protein RimM [bacterium]|nr:16S rRNA processing protein RimM [bacterium]